MHFRVYSTKCLSALVLLKNQILHILFSAAAGDTQQYGSMSLQMSFNMLGSIKPYWAQQAISNISLPLPHMAINLLQLSDGYLSPYTLSLSHRWEGSEMEGKNSFFLVQYKLENITEKKKRNNVVWLLKMKMRSISVCCKLIEMGLQIRDDEEGNEFRDQCEGCRSGDLDPAYCSYIEWRLFLCIRVLVTM